LASLDGAALIINAGISTLVIVIAAVASFTFSKAAHLVFRRLLRQITPDVEGANAPGAVLLLGQIAVWGGALVLVLGVWGLNLLAYRGGPLLAGGLKVLAILILSVVAWELAIIAIGAVFRNAAAHADAPRRAAQLRSLAPLTRGAARTLIALVAGMLIVSQLGVEIGPLLAGAGVVGIAIGFGAQTLVKDYLTGFSLVLEDIVSIGDIVRIGDSGGLVETMTLRTIRLRDFDGTLHVVPYSEAQTVHNLTKTFSYYFFNLPISYDSDIDRALSLMRSVGEEMQHETQYASNILEPIEVVGVDQLGDSGVLLKARIKTAPTQQWNVGREYNRRIKLAFDKAGIEIPVPHLKLLLSDRALAAVRPA
jgi:small conductance mechanosensitive channel